jgi:malate dehydrogenase (oxaloacetate-decarboxylating)
LRVLTGRALIEDPLKNKGTAFSETERAEHGLHGLLPWRVETLAEQAARCYDAFRSKSTDLERHIYLRSLQDTNETVFYRLLVDHLPEMLPIVYTPVVGDACAQFSRIYRRPRGLFLAYPQRERMDEMLAAADQGDVEVIVVTDGERTLGLGDLGVGGMGISIGKLSLYVAGGGIHPAHSLPIVLDVGTDNEELLASPYYIGWRHKRVRGPAYTDFVDAFVDAVKRRWPAALVQFEDFAIGNAGTLLERYRHQLCMFNDDIQGTAAVALGTLLAAADRLGTRLADHRFVVVGGGSAGCGIASQVVAAMMEEGSSAADAQARIFVVDQRGLLHEGTQDLLPFQHRWRQPRARVPAWQSGGAAREIPLLEVVEHIHPTVLIGVSGQPGLFTEPVVRAMARHAPRPIVLPLSNPTRRMEAAPSDLLHWTNGAALVATGSPVPPVELDGQRVPIAQCNNAYIFPGLGLGVVAARAERVSDEMLRTAARALAAAARSLPHGDSRAPLLPPIDAIRAVARRIALAVGLEAQRQQVAPPVSEAALAREIDRLFWEPHYP